MKKSIGNSIVCVGSFCGPEIEEGTFHHFDVDSLGLHQKDTKKCPCPPTGANETKLSEGSNEDNDNDGRNDG